MKLQKVFGCCLTIAGSDSGGNAGIQADLRTFHAYSLHACTVLTALTAQNPFGVAAIHSVPDTFVTAQLDAVLTTYDIRALKTGMLSNPEIIEAVADRVGSCCNIAKVIDPVMVATSGARLVSEAAIKALAETLLPLATLMTPNLPEAEVLCAGLMKFDGLEGIKRVQTLAKGLFDKFGCAVLVKGGHGSGMSSTDILYDGKDFAEFSMPRIIDAVSTHGTGCSLAAALASELALGRNIYDAVAGAKRYVYDAIANSYFVGKNCGVLGFVNRTQV